MSTLPPSLGDENKVNLALRREEHELPSGDRRILLSKIESILNQGGVQRLLLQVGKPIQVDRLVRAEELPSPPEELPPDDLLMAVRNGKMVELEVRPDWDACRILFQAFQELAKERLKAQRIYLSNFEQVQSWMKLGRSEDLSQLFGVRTTLSSHIPVDAIVLAATAYDDDPATAFGIRIPVDSITAKGKS
jgi:hypothetical protein